ncbi:NB-ARC domain, LRR domain containing protein [Trema orientale]|uniref:NB-ARC domain, LRR domain containing protein n=1 Tax=Trema orientale TaxID=63057 RepID=A0A2P5EH55_TREOI|nr:NB-ARC domain, LRR domain containing protein [Trema orientale]
MAAELVGGALLSALLDALAAKLDSEVVNFFKGKESIVKLVKELKTTLSSAGLLLIDAEEKLIRDQAVKKWLDDLKETIYDADDLVYKIDTEALRSELEGESQSSCTCKVLLMKLISTPFTAFDQEIKPEIEEILGKLKVLLENKDLGLRRMEKQRLPERVYAPLVEECHVYGRDVEKEAIIKLLLSDDASGDKLSVIPIVGMGGIGKTTLAQLVYNDERVSKKFDTKVWVTVGDDKVDCLKVMKIIIEKVTTEECKIVELFELQIKLKEALKTKKFLFVLDDIWDEDPHKWDMLKTSFESGLCGSKIIVTTRSKVVASIMKTGSIQYDLEGVSLEDSWLLFSKQALIDANSIEYSNLQEIGKKIADKCKGLPLAIKSLGGLLREGLLHSTKEKRIEEVGEEYIEDLISRSFFQPSSEGEMHLFTIHDLMHDLAIFVSGEFCMKMDDTKFPNCASKIRHLSYHGDADDPNKFEGLSKAKGLRTFLTWPESKTHYDDWSLWVEHLFESFLRSGSCMRVLSLTICNKISKLPASIGDLKYLKYLDLSWTRVREVPDSVCNLYNLETLLLNTYRIRLPMNIGNLINLRHLRLYYGNEEEMPWQIGKLKNLQTLNEFFVGKSNGSAGIKHLKELQHLHGELHIRGLENVVDVKDVHEAELKNKKFLSKLIIMWEHDNAPYDAEKQREVLGALQPHAKLKHLDIGYYKGTSFPDWVGDHHSYSNLVSVNLFECGNCCFVPTLGQLSSLRHLKLTGFYSVVSISSEFYSSTARTKPFRSLEILELSCMYKLQEWLFIEGQIEGGVFPHLTQLSLRYCDRLKVSLPNYLPSLRKLEITHCDKLEPLLPGAQSQQMDAAFPALEILDIRFCDGQELLLEGGLPSSLKHVKINRCDNLKALDEEAFHRLTSLESLEIRDCRKLWCLPRGLSTSLSCLAITDCDLLKPRIQRETGEDWPIVAHIPTVSYKDECSVM